MRNVDLDILQLQAKINIHELQLSNRQPVSDTKSNLLYEADILLKKAKLENADSLKIARILTIQNIIGRFERWKLLEVW